MLKIVNQGKCWPNDHKEFGGHAKLCAYDGASRHIGYTCGRTVDCKQGRCVRPKKINDNGEQVDDMDKEPVCTILGTGRNCRDHQWCESKECWHYHCLAGKDNTVEVGGDVLEILLVKLVL